MSGKGGSASLSLRVVTTAMCEVTNLQYELHLSLSSKCTWSRLWEAAVQMWLSDVLHGDVRSWCDRDEPQKRCGITQLNIWYGK